MTKKILSPILRSVLRIEKGEWTKTILMFFYFFLTLATLYILKPVRSSLFLVKLGAENLRYVYIGEGIFLIFITYFYVHFSKKLKKNIFFSLTTLFFVVNLLCFWWLFRFHWAWISYIFYIWVACFSVTAVTQFWILANDIFNPREAKRLFGLIISGGSLGGITGGFLTNKMVKWLGTENLIIIAALILSICILVINIILKKEKAVRSPSNIFLAPEEGLEKPQKETSAVRLLLSSRYLILLASLICLTKALSTLVDNQFQAVVAQSFTEKNAMTAFFGNFSIWLNACSFALQFFITSLILRFFGIGISLLLLPIGISCGSLAILLAPILLTGTITKIYDGSVNYSIYQASKEILYLPIESSVRYKVKPIIDMVVYRLSKSLGGLLIIAFSFLLGIKDTQLGIVCLLLAPLWLFLALSTKKGYIHTIKDFLEKKKTLQEIPTARPIFPTTSAFNIYDEKSFDEIKTLLNHRSTQKRKMSAAACSAFFEAGGDINRVRRLVEEMLKYEALEVKKETALEEKLEEGSEKKLNLDDYLWQLLRSEIIENPSTTEEVLDKISETRLAQLSNCLLDEKEDITVKRKVTQILSILGTPEAIDILLNSLAAVKDNSLRFNIIRSLNRIKAKNQNSFFKKVVVKEELTKEVANYKRIVQILGYYSDKILSQRERPAEDFLLAALGAIQVENLERIFRLLALLYNTEVIFVIYDHLLEKEEYVKSHAIELLDNVLEPDLGRIISPVLDKELIIEQSQEDVEEILKEFIAGGDSWLAICSILLVATLELKNLYSKIEQATLSPDPLVKEAAGIAKMKLKFTIG